MTELEQAFAQVARSNLGRSDWEVPLDYFNWGRDKRHKMQTSEALPEAPAKKKSLRERVRQMRRRGKARVHSLLGRGPKTDRLEALIEGFRSRYSSFDETYALMADERSRTLFVELIYMKLVTEQNMRLSSFTNEFIESYETASRRILDSKETLAVYGWDLRKVALSDPQVSLFTTPVFLNQHLSGRLYRYQTSYSVIGVSGGDVVIDAGVGWGDTSVYFASIMNEKSGGHLYSFDVLKEGLSVLAEQIKLNPGLDNISPIHRGLSDNDEDLVFVTSPSPGARITEQATGTQVKTTTIDTYMERYNLPRLDMIKMDIEGSEVPALKGGAKAIERHKPKLAICVYHKWDDLFTIPRLIHSIRGDYRYYLDCTTGFGGEAVLYCD